MTASGTKQMILKLQEVITFLKAQEEHESIADGLIDGLPLERVEKLGQSAHLHLLHAEEHGALTQADSIKIRRDLYGAKVRSTANQFGTANSGALFFRAVVHGQKVSATDAIELTDTGVKLAKAYRKLHNL